MRNQKDFHPKSITSVTTRFEHLTWLLREAVTSQSLFQAEIFSLIPNFDIKAIYGILFLQIKNPLCLTLENYSDHYPLVYVSFFDSRRPIFSCIFVQSCNIVSFFYFRSCVPMHTCLGKKHLSTSVFIDWVSSSHVREREKGILQLQVVMSLQTWDYV